MKPQRIKLSRAKGFRLQEASLALNGLPAVKVDRTTKWGNPFAGSREQAALVVAGFRCVLAGKRPLPFVSDVFSVAEAYRAGQKMRADIHQLRGKNLACWCALDVECHADVLLELANKGDASE